jgi:hypothetical protein
MSIEERYPEGNVNEYGGFHPRLCKRLSTLKKRIDGCCEHYFQEYLQIADPYILTFMKKGDPIEKIYHEDAGRIIARFSRNKAREAMGLVHLHCEMFLNRQTEYIGWITKHFLRNPLFNADDSGAG